MSDNPTSRSSRENQPKDKEHTFVGPASEYVECVERLKAIFPDENDKGALIAAIEGCVEIMVNPRASDAAGDIDFPPPPPLAQRSGTGAVPRKKTKPIFTQQQMCWMSRQTYDHIYHLWAEHGKPQSGPLYDSLINAYKDVDRWCYGGMLWPDAEK